MGWGPIRDAITKAAAVENHVRDAIYTPDNISGMRRALVATQEGHAEYIFYTAQLATQLGIRYQLVGATADFNEAKQLSQTILESTNREDPRHAESLQALARLLQYKFQRTQRTADVNEAIQYDQELLEIPVLNATQRASGMNHLALCLRNRFGRGRSPTDIVEAARLALEAFNTCPEEDSKRAQYQSDLALALFEKHEALQTSKTLEEAMSFAQQAILSFLPCHSDRMDLLTNLAKAHHDQYRKHGNIADLEAAIKLHQDSKDMARVNSPQATNRSHLLGMAYLDRFRRTQSGADLKVAMKEASQAVYGTMHEQSERPARLVGLGLVYHETYRRTGNIADLGEATRLYQAAVDSTDPADPCWPDRLHRLGHAHLDRHQARVPGASLELAARLVREGVDLTPPDHSDRAGRLETLGQIYRAEFQDGGTSNTFDASQAVIDVFEEAVHASPPGHPSRASLLHSLGLEYASRFRKLEDTFDLTKLIEVLRDALEDNWSNVYARLAAGRDLSSILVHMGDWNAASEICQSVINLMPSLTPLSLGYADKRRLLSDFNNFASDACAIALNADKSPFEALECLELGRGILAGSLSDLYADISELRQRHPEIAEKYTKLRDEVDNRAKSTDTPRRDHSYLERQGPMFSFPSEARHQANRFYEANKGFESILAQIRVLPGFQDFLRTPSEQMVKQAAENGPLIVINASKYRSDAILVTSEVIRAISLPSLHATDIEITIKSGEVGSLKTLAWLWKAVAEPVLDTLGFTCAPDHGDTWPRVWWIPTGPLARFPLHAAGLYNVSPEGTKLSAVPTQQTVLDRVMSSYSTSIKAIIHTRSSRLRPGGGIVTDTTSTTGSTTGKAVLLAMEITPNQPRLPYAKQEISQILPRCIAMNLDPVIPIPLKEGVMSDLATGYCRIFHFAGHGHTNDVDALESYLSLGDTSTSQYGVEYERLKVADLWQLNLRGDRPSPFLAYLSACSTGAVDDGKSDQESIHLIGAFQAAGFRHVIGTLWEVNDALCVDMARITYEEMSKSTKPNLQAEGKDDEGVCRGLHEATRELRGRWVQRVAGKARVKEKTSGLGKGVGQNGRRKVILCEDSDDSDDELTDAPHWIPYVHFGV